jgi:hypothetical protein
VPIRLPILEEREAVSIMVTATVLLVIGVIGMAAGLWLLYRKRQYVAGAFLFLAGLAVFFVGFAWPTDYVLVVDGGPSAMGAPEPPQPAPVDNEGS